MKNINNYSQIVFITPVVGAFLSFFLYIISIDSIVGQSYNEIYRPQYHISPKTGFMGDPNGPIKFEGKYRLYWWGHMASDDLIYWKEITKSAINGVPGGYGVWSGCVVIDTANTSKLSENNSIPRLAIFTLHNNSTGVQQQAAALSHNASSFEYISQNPLIDTGEKDFRDPQVFWYEELQKWVMVVTKPDERAVRFYDSSDLLNWQYKSTFKHRGARKEFWEVPDLFQLPVNGDTNEKKWVLTCGMGPNRMQYWVGNFDGTHFTLSETDNLVTSKQVKGIVFEDFESGFNKWTIQGEAFGQQPANGALPNQQEVFGFSGYQFCNSFHNGDATTGKLTSETFMISKRHINFLVGGGSKNSVGISLLIDDQVIETVKNTRNSETMHWRGIDVSEYLGKNAKIVIFDDGQNGWEHILVDHIVFSDVNYDMRTENANWIDWGYDYYAGKSFRNYDNDDDRLLYIAWLGNWNYAREVPTSPWQGCESLIREMSLQYSDASGYTMIQQPYYGYNTLRYDSLILYDQEVLNNFPLSDFKPGWNVYEIKVTFQIEGQVKPFGLKMAAGPDQEILVEYDPITSNIFIDRSKLPYNFNYKHISKAPVFLKQDSLLDLHIFVDQSSIEIFANDYETRLSCLAFNEPSQNEVSFYSDEENVQIPSIEAYKLKSIWGNTTNISKEKFTKKKRIKIFPNPVGNTLNIISSDNQWKEDIFYELYTSTGTLIFKGHLTVPGKISMENLDAGSYIFKTLDDLNPETFLIIKN